MNEPRCTSSTAGLCTGGLVRDIDAWVSLMSAYVKSQDRWVGWFGGRGAAARQVC
jgi:hypothetical protein